MNDTHETIGDVTMLNIILFILIGLIAGILSGFLGVGGGVIIVPSLIYICGFSQLKAQGTSLAILLPPVGILAFIEYYKNGNVDIKAGIVIAITLILGSALSSRLVQNISPILLRKGFAVFMIVISIKMFFSE
ncbi:sulfite exporter TauE/SafE family protein [Clostridium sp. OS1-26]|uniref:sulfite exporter TauE/SafE family protein n=1 Tax=Clostridium sp. OS1-26 TaxID=3070681 RepID=UPI0035A901BC